MGVRLGVSRRHPREAGEGWTVKVTSILKVKGRQVATVRPDATIGSIVRTLTAKSIGAVIVSEDGVNLLGLVSERDIVQALGVYGARTLDLHASDIMVRRPVTCLPDDSVTRLMADMTRHRVRHLPVVEDGRSSPPRYDATRALSPVLRHPSSGAASSVRGRRGCRG